MKKFVAALFLVIGLLSVPSLSYAQDPCSYVCRVPESTACKECRGEEINSIIDTEEQTDPCSYVCRVPGSVECKRCRGEDLTSLTTNEGPLKGGCIDTAIGCIPVTDTNEFIGWILGWAIGVGGGIAFVLIAYSAFMITTSQGNPERLKAGQELLTSAISGLIMLIFSVFILKFIGVDILGLDNFGFGG